jgi:hypothetical protein
MEDPQMAPGSRIDLSRGEKSMVFTLVIQGKLGKEDYAEFMPQLEWQIAKDGRINLLIELIDFRGWTLGGFLEDIRFAVKHYNDIGRIAVVGGGSAWEHGVTALSRPATRAVVRFFRPHEKKIALQWAAEDSNVQ